MEATDASAASAASTEDEAAAAAEKKRLKNLRKKQKQKAKKAGEEGGDGAAADAEPEPAGGEADSELDEAALKKKEANRKKRERKKAKAASDKSAGTAWLEERLAQLKAERAERDAACEPNAVYPYKEWLETSNGWSGPLRPAYVAPQRKVTDSCIAKPDYAEDPDGTPHGEMSEISGRSIKQVRRCKYFKSPAGTAAVGESHCFGVVWFPVLLQRSSRKRRSRKCALCAEWAARSLTLLRWQSGPVCDARRLIRSFMRRAWSASAIHHR